MLSYIIMEATTYVLIRFFFFFFQLINADLIHARKNPAKPSFGRPDISRAL
jgi:hypothetical protein